MDPNVLEIQRACNALGSRLKEDGRLGPVTRDAVMGYLTELANERSDTIPVPSDDVDVTVEEDLPPTQKDGSGMHRVALTLGQQALAVCLAEADKYGTSRVPDADVALYFLTCTRIGTVGLGGWLHDEQRAGNDHAFCAAFQGFCEERAPGFPPSMLPPHRAGALELERDAKEGRRPNERWAPLSEFYDEKTDRFIKAPPSGSLVIYGNRLDATKGHAERLIEASAAGIRSVGANENDRRIVVDAKPIPWRNLERADGTQRIYLRGFIVAMEVAV